MDTLWEFGVANAIAVAVIAPLAYLVARASKRPAWAHAVWLIVLLKLVTPPLLGVPIRPSTAEAPALRDTAAPVVSSTALREATIEAEAATTIIAAVSRDVEIEALPAPVPLARGTSRWFSTVSWPTGLGLAWAGGSMAWLLLALWRIVRFARVVRSADPAPGDLAARVEALSTQIGLRRAPVVVLVKSRVSPMVWTLGGRPRLIVPEALWERLDEDQRSALLVHELAHLKRGDAWVRLLELVATGLYWWHPALWLARKELHRAEEACCDLWVVWALPESRKRYASALVEAVDYLSESRPIPMPMGASGMGQVEDLSRRIRMIMQGDTPRGLTRAGTLATIGLALVLLPWRPTRAQQEPVTTSPARAEQDEASETTVTKVQVDKIAVDFADGKVPRIDEADPAIRAAFLQRADIAKMRERIRELNEGILRGPAALGPGEDAPAAYAKLQEERSDLDVQLERLWRQDYHTIKRQTADLSDVSATLRADLEKAKDRLAWTEQMKAKGYVPLSEFTEARAQVARVEALIEDERKTREAAPKKAAQEVRLLEAQIAIKKAMLARAEAHRELARAELTRLEWLGKKGVGFVSESEMNKAKGEIAVANAMVAEAAAYVAEAEIMLENAIEQTASPDSAVVGENNRRKENPQDPPQILSRYRDANHRMDELESKLDTILKEIEAMRKGTAPAGGEPKQ